MEYAAVVVSVYLMWFFPSFYSRPLIVLPLLACASIIFVLAERDALPMIIAAVLFLVIADALSVSGLQSAVDIRDVQRISGIVIQDSQQKRNRQTGFRMVAETAMDGGGNLFEASGSIYVAAPQSDFFYGDMAEACGYFSGSVFYASSVRLVSRPLSSSLRQRAVIGIKRLYREAGDAGELAALLVLGTGSDGDYTLSNSARRSGLMHVLALSGMHLSIIAAILSPPLSFLLGKRKGEMILFVILFLFSFLSGWRPSLMRAFFFRTLMKMRVDMNHTFILSLLLLLLVFPSSSVDIGAIYSFLSLGGIFILSTTLERALRFFIPLPYAFSASVSASGAALIFSVPLTICVFGEYQLMSLLTSFPINAAISVYMVVALLAIPFPFLLDVLEILYGLISIGFRIAAACPESEGILPYAVMVLACFSLIAAKEICTAVAKK